MHVLLQIKIAYFYAVTLKLFNSQIKGDLVSTIGIYCLGKLSTFFHNLEPVTTAKDYYTHLFIMFVPSIKIGKSGLKTTISFCPHLRLSLKIGLLISQVLFFHY